MCGSQSYAALILTVALLAAADCFAQRVEDRVRAHCG